MKKIIIALFIFITLLILIVLGCLKYIGFFNDNISRRLIQISEIPNVLYIHNEPTIPKWGIEKIVEYNDYFTSPTCTIYFSNDIELEISTSAIDYKGMDQSQIQIGNYRSTIFQNKRAKIYQYNEGKLHYSFKVKRGPDEEVIEEYLKSLNL